MDREPITIDHIREMMRRSRYPYEEGSRFFPSDLQFPSDRLKRACQRFYKEGLMERRRNPRYGYSYKIIGR